MHIETIVHIAGWTDHIHHGLRDLAIAKFGENPNKNNRPSWAPTSDRIANQLLNRLVGAYHYKADSTRLILRVIIMNELYRYITTGNINTELLSRVEKSDRLYWCDHVNRKLLPAHKG